MKGCKVKPKQPIAIWELCGCGCYWCNLHKMHAHECPCLEIEGWETDPYSPNKGVLE